MEELQMNMRERVIRALTFDPTVPPPLWHMYGLMPGTLDRWRREGLPEWVGEKDIPNYFGFDPKYVSLPFPVGFNPPFQVKVLKETDRFIIKTDKMGRVTKMMKGVTTLPQAIDHPIKKPSDWRRLKERLKFSRERLREDEWTRLSEEADRKGLPVEVGCLGFFWFPRDLMGEFTLFRAYLKWPDLIHDILRTYCNLILEVSEHLLDNVRVDIFSFGEDMCYKHGPMISPRLFREFMLPYYREVLGLFRSRGTKLFLVDTDGNITKILPLLIEAGVNVIEPLEVQAGNDIVELRRRFGDKIAFIGGIDKVALTRDINDIEQELARKLTLMKETGGYIAGLDHRVLSETPLRNFEYYVKRVKEILEIP